MYHAEQSPVVLGELLDSEVESVASQYSSDDKKVELIKSIPDHNISILGDAHLLRRMVRNALENAFSFAKTEVEVSLSIQHDGQVIITIVDDGPGLSEDALKSFGVRRMTRVLEKKKTGRLSVGLGSVIMKTVAHLHRGTVTIANRSSNSKKITGALVTMKLPTVSASRKNIPE